jgi:tRNA1(Val) A37 N6-methylase TrmN6
MSEAGSTTSRDAFLGGAVHVAQPTQGYRAGLDAVLLAASCPVNTTRNERILDCGAGVGTVGLCVACRAPLAHVTLIEREPELAALARANSAANGLADRVSVIEADLTDRLSQIPDLTGAVESFDHVLANPPYYEDHRGTRASDPLRARAHAMPTDDLEAWARFMAGMAKPSGTATLVHRVEALGTILKVFETRFGQIKIMPVYARVGAVANRILVQGIKGSRAPLSLMPPLVLYDADGQPTPMVEGILRRGDALSWT